MFFLIQSGTIQKICGHNNIKIVVVFVDIKKVWRARGKDGRSQGQRRRFKPTGKDLKQASLLLAWESKLKGRESTVYN